MLLVLVIMAKFDCVSLKENSRSTPSEENLVQFTTEFDVQWNPVKRSKSMGELSKLDHSSIVFAKMLLQNQDIPYMLVDANSKIKDIMKIIKNQWKLSLPRAVLTIISDATPAVKFVKSKKQERLIEGLINATETVNGLWIITKGFNSGLSKSIGDAFNACETRQNSFSMSSETKAKPVLIGMCRHDMLAHSENLRFPENTTLKFPKENDELTENEYFLNPYHSHFILVKDGVLPKHQSNSFLLRMEDTFTQTQYSSIPCRVPVIALLVQGNATNIYYVLEHMRKRLPVVIIKGSGGLADLIAFAHYEINIRYQNVKDSEYMENLMKPNVIRKICFVFPYLEDNIIARDYLCESILECVTLTKTGASEYLYILDAHDDKHKLENLTYHLLKALFLSQRVNVVDWLKQPKKDLLLTIQWNCCDLALSEVFLTYPKFRIENSVFQAVLFMKDREDFVSLFLQRKFKVHRFLSSAQLLALFCRAISEPYFFNVCWKGILGYDKETLISETFIDCDLNYMIEMLTGVPLYISCEELDLNFIGMYSPRHPEGEDVGFAEQQALAVLIMWALLSNRLVLADVVWKYSGLPVTTALTSSLMLDHLLQYTENSDCRDAMKKQSKKFSEMAIGVFNLAYEDMPCQAFTQLNQQNYIWEDHTLIDIARLSRNKKFVSLPVCQKWISKIFMDRIKIRDCPFGFFRLNIAFKIILSAFLVFPMFIFVTFKTNTLQLSDGSEIEETESSRTTESQKSIVKKRFMEFSNSYRINVPFFKMMYWFWTAPVTKFWVYHVLYACFLSLFSCAVLYPSCGSIWLDTPVCFWILSIILEVIFSTYKSFKTHSSTSLFLKTSEVVFMCQFLMFYVIARIIKLRLDPYVNKVMLCLGLLFFFYRAIYSYLPISPTLGPLLYTLKEMVVKDFRNITLIAFMVMAANGIILQSVIYPDHQLTADLLRKAFVRSWITLFITPTEEFETLPNRCGAWQKYLKAEKCQMGDFYDHTCPKFGIWPYVFGIQYFILLKLVLWTLLFAMFSNRNDVTQEESNYLWMFERYRIVSEYKVHSVIPPPLNLFYYIYLLLRRMCRRCGLIQSEDAETESGTSGSSRVEENYYNSIASKFMSEKIASEEEETFGNKKSNLISEFNESVQYQKKVLLQSKSQVAELEADIAFTRLCFRTSNMKKTTEARNSWFTIHSLSRQSPYPGTKILRFPVPDKYVPWEVKWPNYEPEKYNLKVSGFPSGVYRYVDNVDMPINLAAHDEDTKRPSYQWNIDYTDSSGIYRRRCSWILDDHGDPIIYKLHNGLPQNPMGRTGLHGRGALPAWGPNHFMFLIVTRWRQSASSRGKELEFLESTHVRKNQSLPGVFVTKENRYRVLQNFLCDKRVVDVGQNKDWQNKEDLVQFFTSQAVDNAGSDDPVDIGLQDRGYMDDPSNTDNSWKEIEVWHVHYDMPQKRDLRKVLKPVMKWRLMSEDVFTQLPCEQVKILQKAISSRYKGKSPY